MLDLIKTLQEGGTVEKDTLNKLINKGVISLAFKMQYKMYLRYLEHLETVGKQMVALSHTAEEFAVSEMSVRRALNKFEM
jgi:NADH/NAD ratio-sensing transcriptional regulator Rex